MFESICVDINLILHIFKFVCVNINLCRQEEKNKGKAAEFQPNYVMLGLSPSDFILRALSNVQTNDLEQTLLVCSILCLNLQGVFSMELFVTVIYC